MTPGYEVRRRRSAASRREDRIVARKILAAVCESCGLSVQVVLESPKKAAHAIARRAVVLALYGLGWSSLRTSRATGVSDVACRNPPLEMTTLASQVASKIDDERRAEIRRAAVRICGADKAERAVLLSLCDERGFSVGDVARAVGVSYETISRWRDPEWQDKRMRKSTSAGRPGDTTTAPATC